MSETRHPDSMALDTLSTLEMVRLFNQQDKQVPEAIASELPAVAAAIDRAAQARGAGGRLIYLGAGTSGRLGVLDASECPPTFGVPPDKVIGLIDGGPGALLKAVEGAEDDMALGESDLRHIQLAPADGVVGSRRRASTPYVLGALRYARSLSCATVAVSCNQDSPIAQAADIAISPVMRPEVLTSSTRTKSGTAQKLVLNMISTGAMVKFDKVYQNLMVDVKATNVKLRDRACRIVCEACGVDGDRAKAALAQTDYDVKPAIIMLLSAPAPPRCKRRWGARRFLLAAQVDGRS